jgi:hypothetical protein
MPRVSRLMWLFVLVAPAAWAQPVGGGAPVPGPGPVPTESAAPPRPTISGPQMLEQGREYRKQIEAISLQLQGQVQQAKNEQDVIRLNCLLDKLTQLRVNANMMDQALQSLQEMVSRRDEGAQFHEYTRVTIVNQKVQVLKTEADACVGAETNYIGPTKVVVEKPPGELEGVDQPPPAEAPFTVVDRPPPASPFRE